MGELFAEIGDLVFSLIISYVSVIEFLYVVRHLYHYTCNHDEQTNDDNNSSGDNLSQLQDSMRQQLVDAKNKEAIAGTQVMKDGVLYKDGFRIDAQQAIIDRLKQQLKDKELSDLKRQELENEMAKQMKIAEQLRKELAEAEAKYERQLKQKEEEEAKKRKEEQRKRDEQEKAKREAEEIAEKLKQKQKEAEDKAKREAEQKQLENEEQARAQQEAEENARKLAEVEKQRELEQRKREEEQARAQQEAEENARKLAEAEKQRELEQRKREEEQARAQQEAEENALKLAEAEKQRELEQRKREEEQARAQQEAEENARRIAEEEKQIELEQRKREEEEEAKENERKLLEAERQREEQERLVEEAAAQNLLDIEHRLEEQLRAAEKDTELTEQERQLIEKIREQNLPAAQGTEQRDDELLKKILAAREQLGEESEEEQSLRVLQRQRDQESKQKRIDENALLFMEAEKEMAELQAKILDVVQRKEFGTSLDSAPQTPVVEAPCIKKTVSPLLGGELTQSKSHTVKTQFSQDLNEPYSVSTKPLQFPGVSDDASSIDPASSKQSSFSTQPSEEITTGTESQYPQHERQEPDGEDTALTLQYSDEYLRSLDGIKQRPLMREDGSGRRRAFKKRRSSNSSNSSRESRQSRDEELKMFTSLEEEEMKNTVESDFTPIRYTSEPNLRVKGHHRRHKRSPAKDMRRSDDSLRSSLERLGEEELSNPWGEVKPEHYKNSEFWKREKTLSIDEEMEFEKPQSSKEVIYDTAKNMPTASSFEEATQIQNEEVLTTLTKQTKANQDTKEAKQEAKANASERSARSENTNLQSSQNSEGKSNASPARFSASLSLGRSPRVEKIDQLEESLTETNIFSPNTASAVDTPSINVQTPLDFGPWRDEHGLIMQGLSDFYDFTASVNASRSRSASRNASPANTAPVTTKPKDVHFSLDNCNENEIEKASIEIYDDTDNVREGEINKENIVKFINLLNGKEEDEANETKKEIFVNQDISPSHNIQLVADDPSKTTSESIIPLPMVNVITEGTAATLPVNELVDENMNSLEGSLRTERSGRSGSRSKSPLPTPDNLQRSLENRRSKMIKHNEDILEKLIESKLLPELTPPEEPEIPDQQPISISSTLDTEEASSSVLQTLRVDRSRSRSKSPMRLPTAENLSKSLEKRRNKLIERNDEFFKQLEERSQTPDSPQIVVEYLYEEEPSGEQESTLTSPSITIETSESRPQLSSFKNEDEECSRENMELLVQSLRVAQSRSRSKSPMRLPEASSVNHTAHYEFQHREEVQIQRLTQDFDESVSAPTISIEFAESEPISLMPTVEEDDCSREKMDLLVQSLRVAQSRSRSKSPMHLPTAENLNKSIDSRRNKLIERNDGLLQDMEETAKTLESSSGVTVEYVYEFEHSEEVTEEIKSRHFRSRTPSRSHSTSPTQSNVEIYRSHSPSKSVSPRKESCNEFHIMLNLEGSNNKTLIIKTEEQESLNLANRQRQLDEEALEKLKNLSEEIELRTLSPLVLDRDELSEKQSRDFLADLPITEKVKLLRKSPTTPDYDRTISEEMRDIERIKQERLEKGFKRSTYVGESMDLGSEFEPLRKETARFQRSRSPSPSFSFLAAESGKQTAEEKRKIQDLILQELTTSSTQDSNKDIKNTGAIPKTERRYSYEIELTLTNEMEDTMRIKEEMLSSDFQRSTYVKESVEKTNEYEEMRRRNAEFRRSSSASRSPLNESQREALAGIEAEAVKRELHDRELDKVSCTPQNFQEFSRNLNADFFDNDRRASDTALIRKDSDSSYLDPDEYHHYRRFSLAQEQPVEEYPSEDYIYIEKVEVRTRSGSRTWLREDFYSEEVNGFLKKKEKPAENPPEREVPPAIEQADNIPAAGDDEEYSNNSDDDRQTVVEVDDEIDEDISDFNERGTAEESHHEASECEEADREMDRYAGRAPSDWNGTINLNDIVVNQNPSSTSEDEGAVGGLSNSPYDSDSFAIDQIYDEAVKNRKQSGILREYDSILRQMSSNSDIDEQYLLWSKTQGTQKPKNIEFNSNFIDNERKDTELRYLGDSNIAARQSTRLRSRYGYNPVLHAKCLEDDLEVDLNYKPKREYNWRKNFKLDDDSPREDKEITLEEIKLEENTNQLYEVQDAIPHASNIAIDIRKISLGGESVTLFSQSPESEQIAQENDYKNMEVNKEETILNEEIKMEKLEKPKKKKTKKKLHKETKHSLEQSMDKEDEDAYDSQMKARRSSSIQLETDSPKRKSRSRRSSKSSLTNEDSAVGVLSPRSSLGYAEPIADIMEEYSDMVKEITRPKKMKKRKKVKETMAKVNEIPAENKDKEPEIQYHMELLREVPAVSRAITPESSNLNILSTLSPQNSVCVTPSSIDLDMNAYAEELSEDSKETANSSTTTTSSPSSNVSRTSSITTPVDTFDILKDASFYPLF